MRSMIERAFAAVKNPPSMVMRARSAAPPDVLWRAVADTGWWPRWAPHITAVESAAGGVVAPGQRVRVRGPGPVVVPTTVTRVLPGRAWDFQVRLAAGVTMTSRHVVQRVAAGSVVSVTMTVDGPGAAVAWPLLAVYRPLAALAVRRLAALAASAAASAEP